jgi:HD-like signal output (HDOD) protein
MAARVLKIANSAMFSRQREITTLNQAIMIIGFKALKGIVVAAALRQINKHLGKMQQLVWENSIGCAMAANLICKKLRRPYTDEIFLLGLLHSLGQLVLLVQPDTAKDYRKVLNLIRDDGLNYAAAEQLTYGFAHPLIGALVAKKWNFSAETCQIILHYADPLQLDSIDSELEEKTATVQLAELLTHKSKIGSPDGYMVSEEQLIKVGTTLGFDKTRVQQELEQISSQLQERFEQERHVYG